MDYAMRLIQNTPISKTYNYYESKYISRNYLKMSDFPKYPTMNILLIDDDEIYQKAMKAILEMYFSVNVYSSPNPVAGFQVLGKEKIHAIILDMQMPMMDGMTALEALKNNPATQNIPVIGCSSLADKNLILRLGKLKISAYLMKPFDREIAVQKISKVLETIKLPEGN